jgi:ribonuclease P protein component
VPERAAPRGRFQAASRIRKRREYRAIQGGGARAVLTHFVLIFRARDPAAGSVPRVGVTASRKIGGAVQRNRAKRLVREAFRATRRLFPPDVDMVVIVRTALGTLRLDDVVHEWESAAGLIGRRIEAARRGRSKSETGA